MSYSSIPDISTKFVITIEPERLTLAPRYEGWDGEGEVPSVVVVDWCMHCMRSNLVVSKSLSSTAIMMLERLRDLYTTLEHPSGAGDGRCQVAVDPTERPYFHKGFFAIGERVDGKLTEDKPEACEPFGLIERLLYRDDMGNVTNKRTGHYRLTSDGFDFLCNSLVIEKSILMGGATVVGYSKAQICMEDLLAAWKTKKSDELGAPHGVRFVTSLYGHADWFVGGSI